MNKSGNTLIVSIIILLILIVIPVSCYKCMGIGGWGPTNTHIMTVTDKKIDVSGSNDSTESHYMVYGKDKNGEVLVFEVDNGPLLGVWKADKIYAQLEVGKTYQVTTKGREVVGMFFQEYAYVIKVDSVTLEQ